MEGTYKYRVKYKKYGVMKFLGHLDVLRFFQKAIKRSGIPIAYSEGFNPHQLLSFAAPLSVGVESEGEYFDMELTQKTDEDFILKSLNDAMVEGMEIESAGFLSKKVPNAMASVTAASYTVFFEKETAKQFYDFLRESRQILILKKTKKSEREIDLKPLIYEYSLEEDDHDDSTGGVYILLPCGSQENIKPKLVIDAFESALSEVSESDAKINYKLYRRDLFMGTYPDIKSLMDID